MDEKLLNLHLIQVRKSLNKSKNNIYSDLKKHNYHKNLENLFEKISFSIETETSIDLNNIIKYKRQINFIFKSIEILDSSTLNLIPYEIVSCLQIAMNEWLETSDKYIIVTSLVNDINGYSFDPSIAFNDDLFQEIKIKYAITFEYRLVQINLPRALSRDYLSSVVLYHELGHFIDFRYSISDTIIEDVISNIKSNNSLITQYNILFPFINEIATPANLNTFNYYKNILLFHMREYFADVFASQYIGECSNYYLKYITAESLSQTSQTHPSTLNRIDFVNLFLNDTNNFILTEIKAATQKITSKEIVSRHSVPDPKDFLEFLPINITQKKEIHGLYSNGWDLWISNENDFPTFEKKDKYNIINNLIEKSIGNFIISEQWKSQQQS
jgi:hypothetical protein